MKHYRFPVLGDKRAAYLILVVLLGLCLGLPAQAEERAHNPKIETALETAAALLQERALQPLTETKGICIKDGLVKAVLESNEQGIVDISQLHAMGGQLISRCEGLVEAWLPLERLNDVAQLPGVAFIRRPYIPVPLGSVGQPFVSQGVPLVGGTLFHSKGLQGAGVKIAIIDVGFSSLSYAREAGEFPEAIVVWTRDYTGKGLETGGAHGTGVAEIVHDMAPKAELYLAKIGNEVNFSRAVTACIHEGVDIIVHSVGWTNTNFGDGTGVIAEITKLASAAGILWVNAAGNHARKHWIGAVEDDDHDGWVEFAPGLETLELEVEYSSKVEVALTWDQWPHARADFDLFLLDAQGRVVASSQNHQTGWGDPAEDFDYSAVPGHYWVKVKIKSGYYDYLPLEIELFSLEQDLSPYVPERSILAPGNVEAVVTVGAIDFVDWQDGPQEPFSSQGPTNAGGLKPDSVAPDGVTTFAFEAFYGTSAAAPHVGGAAALLLGRARDNGDQMMVEDLRVLLIKETVDMGAPGPDTIYGAGRTQLMFDRAQATRSLSTPIVDAKLIGGDSFSAELMVRMPTTQLGGLTLEECLPSGFTGVPLVNDGAAVTVKAGGQTISWEWPFLDPGELRKVAYRVTAAPDQAVGEYTIAGRINDEPVLGEDKLWVIQPLLIPEAVSHWRADLQQVDMGLDSYIDEDQIEAALTWWQKGEAVPCTHKQIDLATIQRLIGWWLAHRPVDTEPPKPPSTEPVVMHYQLPDARLWPGGNLEVTLEIEVRQQLYGLAVEQRVPSGWRLAPVEGAGALFKDGGEAGKWLWTERLPAGSQKLIQFTLYAPDNVHAGAGIALVGAISSGWPEFELAIESSPVIVESAETIPFVLEDVVCVPNPVLVGGAKFRASGVGIQDIQVRVYNLAGRMVFDSGWYPGPAIEWNLQTMDGGVVANGVYLYWVAVRGANGGIQHSKLAKLLVVR